MKFFMRIPGPEMASGLCDEAPVQGAVNWTNAATDVKLLADEITRQGGDVVFADNGRESRRQDSVWLCRQGYNRSGDLTFTFDSHGRVPGKRVMIEGVLIDARREENILNREYLGRSNDIVQLPETFDGEPVLFDFGAVVITDDCIYIGERFDGGSPRINDAGLRAYLRMLKHIGCDAGKEIIRHRSFHLSTWMTEVVTAGKPESSFSVATAMVHHDDLGKLRGRLFRRETTLQQSWYHNVISSRELGAVIMMEDHPELGPSDLGKEFEDAGYEVSRVAMRESPKVQGSIACHTCAHA